MKDWFYFTLKKNVSFKEACKELLSFQCEECSLLEDTASGDQKICAKADLSLFPTYLTTIRQYEIIPPTTWEDQWRQFCPYFQGDLCNIPLSDFFPSCQETLQLYPGPGFGDLSHPTTCLMMKLMNDYIQNTVAIDLGCGSGVLSLAALKAGARFVYSLDIEEEALIHTRKNAALNHLQDRLQISRFLNQHPDPTPSLLLMNMTFLEQKQAFSSLPTSLSLTYLISSGILKTQKQAYLSWVQSLGFTLVSLKTQGEWIGCVFTSRKA